MGKCRCRSCSNSPCSMPLPMMLGLFFALRIVLGYWPCHARGLRERVVSGADSTGGSWSRNDGDVVPWLLEGRRNRVFRPARTFAAVDGVVVSLAGMRAPEGPSEAQARQRTLRLEWPPPAKGTVLSPDCGSRSDCQRFSAVLHFWGARAMGGHGRDRGGAGFATATA